jgi:hypothetical protein
MPFTFTDGRGPLTKGDKFEIADPETGEVFTSTVTGASFNPDDSDATLLWGVVTDDGTPWDLFPDDLKDPTFKRLEAK